MSFVKSLPNEKENYDSKETNFMTKFQFVAVTKHFQKILDDIDKDEGMRAFQLEFAKLLDAFKSCYAAGERKTRKIRELLATNAVELQQQVESMTFQQEGVIDDLRRTIQNLQKDVDAVKEQRDELLKEIEYSRKKIQKEDKSSQVGADLPRFSPVRDIDSDPANANVDNEAKQLVVEKEELKINKEITDIKVLRCDLDILVADLKFTRKNLSDLKKDLRSRDVLIREYSRDLSDSDSVITELQRQLSEIRSPLEMALKKCRSDLEKEKKNSEEVAKDMQVLLSINKKLSKDIESKGCVIDDLNAQVQELCLEKDAAERKANTFEEHLAQSQGNIKALEQEVQTLREEVQSREDEIPIVANSHETQDKDNMDVNAQERQLETLKHQIATRDKKLHQVIEQLTETGRLLQGAKRDFTALSKEKISLEFELQDAREKLKERNAEVRGLRDQSAEDRKELEEAKKNLRACVKQYQQVSEKKNKFHNLYNLVKRKSYQQENENAILGKRQQYLVKILKDKDKEIEKLVSWKRYVV